MTERRLIPDALRIAVRNAMGGYGPYVVREIEDLFRTYGFSETKPVTEDISGMRREVAETHQLAIDWGDADEKRRYLMLVEDVLREYPEKDGRSPKEARDIERALRLAGLEDPPVPSGSDATDLWHPPDAPRVFISHRSQEKLVAEEMKRSLGYYGFASFVAHSEITPTREWRLEIQRALRSCDLLIALVTKEFHGADSMWVDQEVGWVLGRDLAIVAVSLDGTNPKGFLESYQAVKRHRSDKSGDLPRRVFISICDAVFRGQRPQAATVVDKIVPLALALLGKAKTEDGIKTLYGLLETVPKQSWENARLQSHLRAAREKNRTRLTEAGVYDGLGSLSDGSGRGRD